MRFYHWRKFSLLNHCVNFVNSFTNTSFWLNHKNKVNTLRSKTGWTCVQLMVLRSDVLSLRSEWLRHFRYVCGKKLSSMTWTDPSSRDLLTLVSPSLRSVTRVTRQATPESYALTLCGSCELVRHMWIGARRRGLLCICPVHSGVRRVNYLTSSTPLYGV